MHSSIDFVLFWISALLFYGGFFAIVLLLAANLFVAAYLAVNRRWVSFKSFLKVGFFSFSTVVFSTVVYVLFMLTGVTGINKDVSVYETYASSSLIGAVTIVLVTFLVKSLVHHCKQPK